MTENGAGQIAVIFLSQRNDRDTEGYDRAAADMVRLAREQPGFLGLDSTRGVDGIGITISYWADESAARAWRDHPDHVRIRQSGRDLWYDSYSVTVAGVNRRYDWQRDGSERSRG
ncbi:MAG: antibiotic biosynthesis monooxygenase [Sphingomonas sp.]|nr:antibiotic biosynthesis monooxygenase [Sphingomonas sp.]